MRAYYFGCVRESGHYFWTTGLEHDYDAHKTVPWGYWVDDHSMISSVAPQGTTRLYHKNGWTLLLVADRSVDKRPGSKSGFIFDAPMDELEAWRLAREHFPSIVERLEKAKQQGEGWW